MKKSEAPKNFSYACSAHRQALFKLSLPSGHAEPGTRRLRQKLNSARLHQRGYRAHLEHLFYFQTHPNSHHVPNATPSAPSIIARPLPVSTRYDATPTSTSNLLALSRR